MDVTHRTRTQEKTADSSGLFMVTNRKGGYLLLGDDSYSHFSGLTFMLPDQWTLYKTIHDISLDVQAQKIVNNYVGAQRYSENSVEKFFLFNKTLYYEVSDYQGGITLDLDMRRIYDFTEFGRIYKIYYEDGVIVVEYDDNGSQAFLIISGSDSYTLLNSWEQRNYSYDASRSQRSQSYIYRALRFECLSSLRLSFTFGQEKESAKRDAKTAWDDWDLIRNKLKQHANSIKTTNGIAHSTAVFALESCLCTINHDAQRTGIFAGYPWFFHFWARDELISLQGLILAEKYQLVKDILTHYLHLIASDGRLPNTFPAVARGNADAIGWLFKRYADLIIALENNKLLYEYFSVQELCEVFDALENSLRLIRQHYEVDGLITNSSQETWMDTLGLVGDARAGARIEIQALTLAMVKTHSLLSRLLKKGNGHKIRTFEKDLRERVRQLFFRDGMLFDGFQNGLDRTIRPNIFLAAYLYPELLSKKEWVGVFHQALNALWLDWGGLSSIDKNHPWFCPDYNAVDDASYHRGDSWFWVNNLAALAMLRIAPEEFSAYIQAITDASVDDLLWCGVVGHGSEISSAAQKTSAGCLAQAWSAATLIELLDELNKNKQV